MRKVVVLPRVKGNGHGGSFVGRRGNPKLKHVVDGNKIYRSKTRVEIHC
ncbi:hypothetical protein OAN59_07980 [Alphaproteobacteria bacterium]|nr:hypothetical protein [Alphaproteobacteria bacterium]